MKLKLRTGSIELKLYGFATEINYEKRNGKALDLSDSSTITVIELFYCLVQACLQREKKDMITFEDFFDDLYDLNEGDITIARFYKWYLDQKIAQNKMLPKILEDNKEEGEKN